MNFISPRVDDQTQSILVKGLVRNPDGRDARRRSRASTDRLEDGRGDLVVPVTAALRINGQYFAFVAEEAKGPDGKPRSSPSNGAIKVGPIAGDSYSVLDGLKAGDRVVVSGAQKLADGAPIAPQ